MFIFAVTQSLMEPIDKTMDAEFKKWVLDNEHAIMKILKVNQLMFDEPIIAESCESIDNFNMDYQNQEFVNIESHVMSYDKGSSIQKTFSTIQLPCDEVEENTCLDNLSVDILSHESLSTTNFKSFSSPLLVVDNLLFYDHNLSSFTVHENPSFDMNASVDHDSITSPPPFMLNFDYEEFLQEFSHINMEEFFHVDYAIPCPMSSDHNISLSIDILHKKSNILPWIYNNLDSNPYYDVFPSLIQIKSQSKSMKQKIEILHYQLSLYVKQTFINIDWGPSNALLKSSSSVMCVLITLSYHIDWGPHSALLAFFSCMTCILIMPSPNHVSPFPSSSSVMCVLITLSYHIDWGPRKTLSKLSSGVMCILITLSYHIDWGPSKALSKLSFVCDVHLRHTIMLSYLLALYLPSLSMSCFHDQILFQFINLVSLSYLIMSLIIFLLWYLISYMLPSNV